MQNLKSNQIIYVYWQRLRASEYFDCEENNVTNVKKEAIGERVEKEDWTESLKKLQYNRDNLEMG